MIFALFCRILHQFWASELPKIWIYIESTKVTALSILPLYLDLMSINTLCVHQSLCSRGHELWSITCLNFTWGAFGGQLVKTLIENSAKKNPLFSKIPWKSQIMPVQWTYFWNLSSKNFKDTQNFVSILGKWAPKNPDLDKINYRYSALDISAPSGENFREFWVGEAFMLVRKFNSQLNKK